MTTEDVMTWSLPEDWTTTEKYFRQDAFSVESALPKLAIFDQDAFYYTARAREAKKYISPLIWLIGIVGNISIIVVFFKRSLQKSTLTYMCSLACSDLFYVVVSWTVLVVPLYSDRKYNLRHYDCSTGLIFSTIPGQLSSWYLVLLTLERVVFLYKPLWRQKYRISTPRFARCMVAGVTLVVLAVNWASFGGYRRNQGEDPPGIICVGRNEFFVWYSSIDQIVTTMSYNYLPTVLIFLFNILISVQFCCKKQNRDSKNGEERKADERSSNDSEDPNVANSDVNKEVTATNQVVVNLSLEVIKKNPVNVIAASRSCGENAPTIDPVRNGSGRVGNEDWRQQASKRVTGTVLTLSIAHIVLNIPFAVAANLAVATREQRKYDQKLNDQVLAMITLNTFFLALNHAINGLLYTAVSPSFRKVFLERCGRKIK